MSKRMKTSGSWVKGHIPWNKGKPSCKKGKRYIEVGAKRMSWNGYIGVFSPDHPNKNRRGFVREHRLVMEQKLGRLLNKNEVVHHINGDRVDNRVENLVVLTNKGEHSKLHAPTEATKQKIREGVRRYNLAKRENQPLVVI